MVTTMSHFTRIVIVFVLLAFTTSGCAAAPKQTAAADNNGAGASGEGNTIAPIRAEKLLPASDAHGAFKVMTGSHKGDLRDFTRTFKDGKWTIMEKGDHRGFYHRGKDGQIILDREDDFEENVRVDYDPGIVVIPAVVGGKDPLPHGKVKMIVKNLKTGHQRDHGTCTYKFTGVQKKRLKTPAGSFDVYVIEQKRHLDLNLANVDVTIHTGYAPGEGTVLDAVWQTMHTLGIFTSHSHSRLERAK